MPFEGTAYEFLPANVTDRLTGKTLFPSYTLREFEGSKVAFMNSGGYAGAERRVSYQDR